MASRLPALPRFVFTVFEPISLLAGFVPAVFLPDWFVSEQVARSVPVALTDNSRVVAQQLGNCYGLAFLVGVAVLYTSNELHVVRNYLIALLIADVGHLAITYGTLEYERIVSVGDWNPMTWGNVGITLFLFLTRTAYLMGLFGPDAPAPPVPKKSQ